MWIGLGIGIGGGNTGGGGGAAAIAALFQNVNADGWSADYASPPTFNPSGAPEYFTVSRQGYVGAVASTITEDLICTQRIRQAYPSQASLTTDQVALSDYIYSTDTVTGATNASAETSPKPVANWAMADRQMVGNTVRLEVVAFHRNARAREEVAAVEFRATDGSTTVTQIVTTSSILGHAEDLYPIIGYVCDLDISTLSNPATITVNAKVYPHIGAAASVLDSADQSGAREFSPRFYRRDTALAATPVYAYVNSSTGNDTTGAVSATAATAEASPCATISGAISRLHSVNGRVDGCIIRCMAGTHVLSTGSIVATRTQDYARLVVTRDPNASRAGVTITFGAGATRLRLGAAGGWLTLDDVSVQRTGVTGPIGEAASLLVLQFERCNFNNNAQNAAVIGGNADTGFAWTTFSGLAASALNAGSREIRMLRGCTIPSATSSIEGWLVLGCLVTSPTGGFTTGSRTASGAIIGFNWCRSPSAVTTLLVVGFSADATGVAIVQNVVEFTSATTATAMALTADGAAGNLSHIILHNNTFVGFYSNGRQNLFYEDGATARTSKLMSCRGNIHVQINTKGDVFVTNGARVGNWAYLYGVGCESEWSQFIDADNGGLGSAFAQAYPGLRASIGTSNSVRNDPLFVAYAGTTSGPTGGAGGGNYALQSGSPCKARVSNPPLRFDLAGATRSATAASVGAYE
jgi:hypothetical protein